VSTRVRTLLQLCALIAAAQVVDDVDWHAVASLADEHLLAGALWLAVQDRADVPDDVARHLAWSRRRTTLDNARYRRQLLDAVRAMNRAGIEPLVLKGGAHLVEEVFAPGTRAMWDLDVLVPAEQLDAAVPALEAIGFTRWPPPPKRSAHEIVVEREHDPGPIEVHFELGDRAITRALATDEAVAAATSHVVDGARLRLLSPTHAVAHNVVHAQAQDFDHAVGAIPVRQLHTFVALAHHHGDAVDWTDVSARTGRLLDAHVELARHLFGFTPPLGRPGASARAHRVRCLTTYRVPGLADAQRNLRLAFDADYLHQRYGAGSTAGLRWRHARTLLRERGRAVVGEVLVPRAR
jgi:hypothetical protein